MGNVLYEFLPGRTITPYVGVGVDFVDGVSNSASTVFAYLGRNRLGRVALRFGVHECFHGDGRILRGLSELL